MKRFDHSESPLLVPIADISPRSAGYVHAEMCECPAELKRLGKILKPNKISPFPQSPNLQRHHQHM